MTRDPDQPNPAPTPPHPGAAPRDPAAVTPVRPGAGTGTDTHPPAPVTIAAIPALAWAILAFALWRSLPLLDAWRHSPLDRLAGFAFVVWLLPVPLLLLLPPGPPAPNTPRTPSLLLGAGLLASVLGTLAAFNAASYLGLALTTAALVTFALPFHVPRPPAGPSSPQPQLQPRAQPPRPPLPQLAAWIASALSWMPALTWLARDLPTRALGPLRLALAVAGSLLLLHALRRSPARP